ncbi:hypothetical protein VaNZ11_002072 [Volvox africanus]|uniref:Uncharacterized protein n=1 Tax=Volvox africanus TaxID=51714 RepID=A0ABQ5RR41_9CHLO|nr:hypothetical protein VaNZ11_002072 [Volvox africanus]
MMPLHFILHQHSALWLRVLYWTSLLCLASCARQLVSPQVTRGLPRAFDYFLLVRQWPGSYCTKHECLFLQDRWFNFTIHGLWPNYKDGTWPQFCNPDSVFNEDELTDLLVEMRYEWPCTFMNSNNDFWEHEWTKHGTCATDVLPNEYSYFDTVLMLHKQYNLQDALKAAGIVPSKDAVYRTKDLEDSIAKMYGVRPVVHCDEDGQLAEIWMCLDRGLQRFDCDIPLLTEISNTCDNVTIAPLLQAADDSSEEAVAGSTEVHGVLYRESTADDSIHWVLDPDSTTPSQLTGGSGRGGDGPELTTDTTFKYLYGDAFTVVQRDDPAHTLELQKQQLEIQAIEQRLFEQDDKVAAESVPKISYHTTVGCSGDGSVGAVTAALMGLAERAFLRLRQHLYNLVVVGGWFCVDARGADDVEFQDGPRPNGGAFTAAKGGARDFVWTSKLRRGTDAVVAFDADETGGRAALVDGVGVGAGTTGGTATLAVMGDRRDAGGSGFWAVKSVLVLPAGAPGSKGGGSERADGLSVSVSPPRPPVWVIILLTFHLAGIVVVTLSLVVLVGKALVGVKRGRGNRRTTTDRLDLVLDVDDLGPVNGPEPAAAEGGCWGREFQPPQQQQQQQQKQQQQQQEGEGEEERRQQGQGLCCSAVPGCSLFGGGVMTNMNDHEEDDLAEPLLLYGSGDSDDGNYHDSYSVAAAPPKIHLALRSGCAFAGEEERGTEREGQPQPQPHEEVEGVKPLHGGRGVEGASGVRGAASVLPVASRPAFGQHQQQQLMSPPAYAPVQ